MAKWTQIEVGKSSSGDADSLNEDDTMEQDDQSDNTEELEDSDETGYEEDEAVEDDVVVEEEDTDTDNSEESVDSDADEESSRAKQRRSRSQERIIELNARAKAAEERERQVRAEMEELKQSNVQARKQSIDSEISSVTASLMTVEKDLKAAIAEGDAEALVKNQKLLSEYTVRKMALESSKASAETEAKKATTPKQQQNDSNEQVNVPQRAQDWVKKNGSWFNKNRALTGAAVGINNDLLAEGYDHESAEFYQELDRRLAPFKPKSNKDNSPDSKSKDGVKPKKSTQVVGESSKTVSVKKTTINEADKTYARRMGIDPKTYLEQRAAYERNSENKVETFKPIVIKKKDK